MNCSRELDTDTRESENVICKIILQNYLCIKFISAIEILQANKLYIYVATEAGFDFAQQYFHNKSYLVTSNDMNNHKHVSNCNKPDGLLK
jgi:hypothetical protein